MPGGVRLYDRASGKEVEFSTPDAAAAALQSGTHAPAAAAPVAVVGPDGTRGTVAGQDTYQLLASGGRLMTDAEARTAQLEARRGQFGTLLGTLNWFSSQGLAAGRGATAGLSDAALVEGAKIALGKERGDEVRRWASDVKELDPLSGVAEIGGATAAALAGGYGSGGARAAGTGLARIAPADAGQGIARMLPSAAIDAVGGAAESAATGLISRAPVSALGRAVDAGIRLGVRGSVEGALYGMGQEVSEAELGDHELNAEKLYIAGKRGALLGGVTGGGLGFAGSLVGSAGRGLARTMAPKLEEAAGEQAWKALSPLKKFSEEANARAGGTAAVGRTLLKEGVIDADASLVGTAMRGATPEDLLPRIQEARSRVGQAIGDITSTSPARVKGSAIVDAIESVTGPQRGKAGFESIVGKLDDYKVSLLDKLGILEADAAGKATARAGADVSLQSLLTQRQALDDLAYREAKALDPNMRVGFLREIRGKIEGLIVDGIDDAAKAAGNAGTRAELESLKRSYQHLRIAEDAAEASTARMATNRNLSLSDYQAAIAAAASGHVLAAPITAIGHQVVRERGNAVAAATLQRLAEWGAVKRAAARADTMVEAAVAGAVEGPSLRRVKTAPARGAGGDDEALVSRYRRARDEVAAQSTDPARLDRIAARAAAIGSATPLTQGAYASHEARGQGWIEAQAPAATVPAGTLTVRPRDPPPEEMSRFLKQHRAWSDPAAVLEDMAAGKVDRIEVQALRATHPSVFAEMQRRAIERATEREGGKRPLTYADRVRLSVLLDVPIDPSVTPQGIRALQSTYQPAPGAPKPPATSAPASAPRRPIQTKPITSALDRIEGGGVR